MAAITSAVIGAGGVAMNFLQASKQNKLQQEAEADAEKAMAAARAQLEQNFYEGLDINLKSFEQERDALAGVGQQLLQAGQEAGRGAAATAGRVMLGMQQGEQDITNRQIDSLEKLERTVAGEESRLSTMKATLDLQEAEGAQQAAADAAKNQASAITAGVQGLGDITTGLQSAQELYGKDKDVRELEKTRRQAGRAQRRYDISKDFQKGSAVGNTLRSGVGAFQNIFGSIFDGVSGN